MGTMCRPRRSLTTAVKAQMSQIFCIFVSQQLGSAAQQLCHVTGVFLVVQCWVEQSATRIALDSASHLVWIYVRRYESEYQSSLSFQDAAHYYKNSGAEIFKLNARSRSSTITVGIFWIKPLWTKNLVLLLSWSYIFSM